MQTPIEFLTTMMIWGVAMIAKMLYLYSKKSQTYPIAVRGANIVIACFIAWLISLVVPEDWWNWKTFIIALAWISSDKILDYLIMNWDKIVLDSIRFKKK